MSNDAAASSGGSENATMADMRELAQRECEDYLLQSVGAGCSFGWLHTEPIAYRFVPPMLRGEHQHRVDGEMVPILEPNEVPVYDIIVDTVHRSAMTPSPKTFGSLNVQTVAGMNAAARMCLFSKALGNPRFGTPERLTDQYSHASTERETHMCIANGRTYPKVTVVYEVLLRETVDDEDQLMSTDSECGLNKLLANDAWIGYRAWYLVHDALMDAVACFEEHIAETGRRFGVSPRAIPMPLSGPVAAERIEDEYAGEREKYVRVAERHNMKVARANAERQRRRAETQDYFVSEMHDYDSRITHPLELYNVVFADMDDRFEMLTGGSDAGKMLRVATRFNNADVGHLLNFRKVFSAHNPTTNARLSALGLCFKQQFSSDAYLPRSGREGDTTRLLVFPVPEFAYCATAIQAHAENLVDTVLPWNFCAIDLLLDNYMKAYAARRAAEHDRKDAEYLAGYKETSSSALDRKYMRSSALLARDQLRRCGTNANADANAAMGEGWRNYIYGSVEAKHLAYTQTPRVRTGEQLETERSDVIRLDSALEAPKRLFIERFRKMRMIWHTLTDSVRRMLTRMLRQAGMREFVAAFQSRHAKNTTVVRAAARTLNELRVGTATAYMERMCILPDHGVAQGMLARQLFEAHSVYGMRDAALFCGIMHDILRTAADADIDELYGHCKDIAHVKNYGPPGTGKSHMQEAMVQTKLPGTFRYVSSGSLRSQNTPKDQSDGVDVYDEITGAVAYTASSTPQEEQQRQNTKQMMTSYSVTHAVLTTPKEDYGRESVAGRKTYSTVSRRHSMLFVSGNDAGDPQRGAALNARFANNTWANIVQGGVAQDVTPLILTPGASSTSAMMDTRLDNTNRWYSERQHPIAVAAQKLMATGGLPVPNIDTFKIHWSHVYAMLARQVPSIQKKNRTTGRMLSRAQAMALSYAIEVVFASEISPLVERDFTANTVKCKPFCMEQVALLRSYLFLPEDLAIHIITEFVHRYYLPSHVYTAARSIANTYCDFYTTEQRKNGLGTDAALKPQYKRQTTEAPGMAGQHTVSYENRGYVTAVVDRQALIGFLKREHGHNYSSADAVLLELEGMCVRAPVHKMDFGDANEGAMRTQHLSVPVLTFTTSVSPITRREVTEVCISTYYLERFLPKEVTERVLAAISYNGIREREVMLGVAREQNNAMWYTHKIRRSEHPLRIANNNFIGAQAKRLFYSNTSLTRDRRDVVGETSAHSDAPEITYDSQDMEQHLCVKWLVDVVGMSEAEAPTYTPRAVDKAVKLLHQSNDVYSNCSMSSYNELFPKESASAATKQVLDQHTSELDLFWGGSAYTQAFAPKRVLQHNAGIGAFAPAPASAFGSAPACAFGSAFASTPVPVPAPAPAPPHPGMLAAVPHKHFPSHLMAASGQKGKQPAANTSTQSTGTSTKRTHTRPEDAYSPEVKSTRSRRGYGDATAESPLKRSRRTNLMMTS